MKVNSSPYFRVRRGGGGGGQMSSHCFLEGANIRHYAFVEGAIILPCQLLGGRCPHMPFFIGGQMSGGKMSGSPFKIVEVIYSLCLR